MYTPYDSLKCVTGEILPVAGTPFDFTTPHVIGERIDEDVMQLNIVKGYDHNWVLNTDGDDTKLAARLIDIKRLVLYCRIEVTGNIKEGMMRQIGSPPD